MGGAHPLARHELVWDPLRAVAAGSDVGAADFALVAGDRGCPKVRLGSWRGKREGAREPVGFAVLIGGETVGSAGVMVEAGEEPTADVTLEAAAVVVGYQLADSR